MKKSSVVKKIISLVLAIAVTVCLIPAFDIESKADDGWTLAQMKASFPHGKYWNHQAKSGHGYAADAGWVHYGNNCGDLLFSVTNHPCYSHNGIAPVGQYDCNTYYNKATQCSGFAQLMADLAYPGSTNVTGWPKVTNKSTAISVVKPGDVIHYKGGGADATWGHWAFVIAVSGSVVTFGECGVSANCNISWGRTFNLNNATSLTLYRAPYQWNPGSSGGYIDVNGNLDGVAKDSTDGFATFDVLINGKLVANDVTDYYVQHPAGTAFSVNDIKATGCFASAGDPTVVKSANGDATVTIFYKTSHTLDEGKITTAPTCTAKGIKTYSCLKCTFTKTEEIAAPGHDYEMSVISATCTENETVVYTCRICNDTYSEDASKNPSWSEWSTEKPNVDESRIESKTQYRYMNKETKLSTEPTLDGWTYVGKDWGEGKKSTVAYVASFPAGFDKNNGLYAQYNKAAPTASESDTKKVVVGETVTSGYIYWHWCSSYYNGNSPINRLINDYYTSWDAGSQRPYNVFHAFYSTEYKNITASAGAVNFSNSNACNQTYWWQPAIPVKSTTVTTYEMMYKFTRDTGWTEWSDTAFSVTDDAQFETRTLYRYRTSGDVATGHKWDNGVITTQPTDTQTGIKTYTCTVCKATKTEVVEKAEYLPGDVNMDGKVNASDARLALRFSAKLETLNDVQLLIADVNKDNKVNAADARIILRVAAQLEKI